MGTYPIISLLATYLEDLGGLSVVVGVISSLNLQVPTQLEEV